MSTSGNAVSTPAFPQPKTLMGLKPRGSWYPWKKLYKSKRGQL